MYLKVFLNQPEFVGLLCKARLLIFAEADAFLRILEGLQNPSDSLQRKGDNSDIG